jgi:hypothetical protein
MLPISWVTIIPARVGGGTMLGVETTALLVMALLMLAGGLTAALYAATRTGPGEARRSR